MSDKHIHITQSIWLEAFTEPQRLAYKQTIGHIAIYNIVD
jgi:hypothetical protein